MDYTSSPADIISDLACSATQMVLIASYLAVFDLFFGDSRTTRARLFFMARVVRSGSNFSKMYFPAHSNIS